MTCRQLQQNTVRFKGQDRITYHATYDKHVHSIIKRGLISGGLSGDGKNGVFMSPKNGDVWIGVRRAGKSDAELAATVQNPTSSRVIP